MDQTLRPMNEVYTDLEKKILSAVEALKPAQEEFNKQMAKNPYEEIARMKREQIEKEDPRYFAPEPEDIHIGYECELRVFYLDIPPRWVAHKLQSTIFNPDNIRVPYLTKEQIEAEGWELKHKSVDLWFEAGIEKASSIQDYYRYKCYKLYLNYGTHDHKLKIKGDFGPGDGFDKSDTLFEGECKDINTLRYICKLLHI